MKLMIAGGGTGGHVSPGLAVAGVWAKRQGKEQVAWAGRLGGIEERMAAAAGIRFVGVQAKPLKRSLDLANLLLPIHVGRGLVQAMDILKREAPDVLLMTGGYVAVPMALAAVLRSTPLVLVEPNAVLGLANWFFSGAAEALCTAYPLPKASRHAVLTGNPVRFPARLPSRAAAREKFGLDDKQPVVLVLPGSGAAHSINVALEAGLGKLKGVQLLWMTGAKDAEAMRAAVKTAGAKAKVHEFIEDVPAAYAAADLVLARCGASMLAEIALAGKPSLLVPYPHATGDHQRMNALGFVEAGAAAMLLDGDMGGGRLAREIGSLLSDPARLKRMAMAARKWGVADAAEKVTGVLERVAKGFHYV